MPVALITGASRGFGRAVAHYELRHKRQALSDIQDAIHRDPRNPELHQWQARIRALPDA